MRLAIFGFGKRPELDSQNTGRDVYERPLGVGNVSVQGQGGANNYRSLGPFNPAGANLAALTPASITGTGSGFSTNPQLEPLIDKSSPAQNMTTVTGPQF